MGRSKQVKVSVDVLRSCGMTIRYDKTPWRRATIVGEDEENYILQVGKKVKGLVVPKKDAKHIYNRKQVYSLLERGLKRCPRCNQIKKLDTFTRSKSHVTGRSTYCRKCESELRLRPEARKRQYESHRKWRERHHDKWKSWSKRYANAHKEQSRKARKEWWERVGREQYQKKKLENPTPGMLKAMEREKLLKRGKRKCPDCGRILDLEVDFYNCNSTTSRVKKSTYCKECTNKRYYRWIRNNHDKWLTRSREYQRRRAAEKKKNHPSPAYQRKTMQAELLKKGLKNCSSCRKTKSISEFHRISYSSVDGLSCICKQCNKERNTKYRKKHSERARERSKKHYAKHKRRRKKMGRPAGSKTKKVLLTRQAIRGRLTRVIKKINSDYNCAFYRTSKLEGMSKKQKEAYRRGMQRALVMARDNIVELQEAICED